jgi:hypothetical protein
MADEPNDIMLDHLRSLRGDTAVIKAELRELKDGQISVRDDIHSLRGDLRRQERAIASLEVDIDRIRDLSDAPKTG